MNKYDVYGIGNALVDIEYEISEAFLTKTALQKGVMTLIDEEEQQRLMHILQDEDGISPIKQCGGGSAANTAVAVAQLGGDSFYSCKVAADETGEFFMRDLQAAGVRTNLNAGRSEGVSGQCLAMITPDAERTMTTHLGISQELSAEELDHDALTASRYLYIEGYLVTSPSAFAAALKAQKIAQEAGVKVSLTLSDPAIVEHFKSGFDQFAEQGVDLLFCNQDEAMIWTASQTREEAFTKLKTVCGQVVMTMSGEGSTTFDGELVVHVPGVPTKPVDTTGAGDVFAGAFLYGITHGQSFPEAASLANRIASRMVSGFGARLPQDEINRLK